MEAETLKLPFMFAAPMDAAVEETRTALASANIGTIRRRTEA